MLWLKENHELPRVLWTALWVVVGSTHVAAQPLEPVIVLQERNHPQDGLVSALQIYLGSTPLQVRDWSEVSALGDRVRIATELAQRKSALAVVWTEAARTLPRNAGGGREAMVFVVGRREGRAMLEVVRVPEEHGPDFDRTLALKVSEVLNELQQSRQAAPNGRLLSAPPGPDTSTAAAVSDGMQVSDADDDGGRDRPAADSSSESGPSDPGLRWAAAGCAGLRLAAQLSPGWTRWGVGAGLGPELRHRHWRAGARIGLDVFPSASMASGAGDVSVLQLTPQAFASFAWQFASFAAGAHSGAAWTFIAAHGRSPLGNSGGQSVRTLSWLIGVDLERAVSERLALGATLDLQLHALRQTFTVNDGTVADLGRAQLVFGVGVSAHLQ